MGLIEIFRYILFFYAFAGVLITGGLLFNRVNKASVFLMLFALVYSIEELDFLYVTSDLVESHTQFFMLWFSICLLGGPLLWFHLRHFEEKIKLKKTEYILHAIPFFLYSLFTIYLLTYSGPQRIIFYEKKYTEIIMPLNYGKVFHVLFYAFLIFNFIKKRKENWSLSQKQYIFSLTGIYIFTSVILTSLTAFSDNYLYFIIYFLATSSIILFVGYILYFKPDLLKQLNTKYAKSGLSNSDKKRIEQKIISFFSTQENIKNSSINLNVLCEQIGERKHHVSETLSNQFKTSFRDLINQYRVNYAKEILMDPSKNELKILAVAFESGYTNKSTFNRAFTKFANCTPLEFRKKQVSSY